MSPDYTPDVIRMLAFGWTMLCLACFPAVTYKQGRKWSAWFAVASMEVLYLAAMSGIVTHFGEPLVWFRTPLILLSDLLMSIYFLLVLTEKETLA